MKRTRDLLIIVVLGGVVVWWVAGFLRDVHQSSVSMDVTVVEAENACIIDGVICHAGYESFQSVEDARAYLNGPIHLAAERQRKEKEEQGKRDDQWRDCLKTTRGSKSKIAACEKLRTPPPPQ